MIPAPLIGCAVLNAGADLAASMEYQAAHAAGAGPLTCGAVALAADVRTLADLEGAYGPAAALWLPLGASLMAHVGAAATHNPAMPAWSSAIVAGVTWIGCRRKVKE